MAPAASSSTAAVKNKLVIRRLPPTLPEEVFWKAVSPWITQDTCLWKRYIKGAEGFAASFSATWGGCSLPELILDLYIPGPTFLWQIRNT